MIRISAIGGRTFAFGLTWQASTQSQLATWLAQRRLRVGKQARLFVRLPGLIGAGDTPTLPKGRVYSYAATLAASAEEGIYVAAVGETDWWIGVVSEGRPAPGADLIAPAAQGRDRVAGLAATLGLPVFATPGIALSVDMQTWQPERVADAGHPVPLQRLVHHSPALPIAAVVVLLAAGAGVFGLRRHATAGQRSAVQARQAKARAVNGYRAAVRGALAQYPADPDWALAAWRRVVQAPAHLAGWTLDTVECKLTGCTLTYTLHGTKAYAISPFRRAFRHVAVDRSGKKIRVTLPHAVRRVTAVGPYLHGAPAVRGGMALTDWRGLTHLHVPDLSAAPTALATNLGRAHHARTLHLTAVMRYQARLAGKGLLRPALQAAITWGRTAHLRVASFTWQPGLTGTRGWAIVMTGLAD